MPKQARTGVGDRLRSEREKKGLTQTALALQCGVLRNHIGKIERGEREPSLHLLCALASALGVTTDELLSDIPADQERKAP